MGRGGALAHTRAPFCFYRFDAHSLRLLSMGITFKLWGFIRLGIGGSERRGRLGSEPLGPTRFAIVVGG